MQLCEWSDLPEFHLYSAVELDKPRLQMQVLAVRIVDVDRTLLVLVLVDVAEVSAKLSTKMSCLSVQFVYLFYHAFHNGSEVKAQ